MLGAHFQKFLESSDPRSPGPRQQLLIVGLGWALLAVVVVLVSLFFGENPAKTRLALPLGLQMVASSDAPEEIPAVRARLQSEPLRQSVASNLFNRSIWVRAQVPARMLDGTSQLLHFPTTSIGRADIFVFDDQSRLLLRSVGGREAQPYATREAHPGFTLTLPVAEGAKYVEVLARIKPLTMSPLRINLWSGLDFKTYETDSRQRSTLMLGALLFLAMYVLTASIAGRDSYFLLFGVWLLARCGLLVVDSGTATYGIDSVMPISSGASLDQWIMLSLPFSTLLLARGLLRDVIVAPPLRYVVTPLIYWNGVFFCTAVFLPYPVFQIAFWITNAVLLVALFGMVKIAWAQGRDTAGIWFALGAIGDSIGSIFGLLQTVGLMNLDSGQWFATNQISLAAAVLAGLAVGQRISFERDRRLDNQGKLIDLLGKYEAVYRTVPIGLVSVGDKGRILRYNEGFARMFGLAVPSDEDRQGMLDAPTQKTLDGVFPTALRAQIRHELASKVECDFEYLLVAPGQPRWLRILARGDSGSYEASATDITSQKALQRQLAEAAEHDPLTGALNRLGLSTRLQEILDTTPPEILEHTAICYVDLDRFKMLNDLFGHNAGDAVLCEVVIRMQRALGSETLVARLGGDEFVMILRPADQSVQEGLAWKALESITSKPFEFSDKSFSVTASIGVFHIVPDLAQTDLIASADRSCQDAKRKGRNQVVVCADSHALVQQRQWELSLVARLHDNRTFEEFEMVAQPIIGLDPNERLACELLLRHRGGDDSLVSAGSLIATAEKNGEMASIDRWVLNQALTWLHANEQAIGELGFVSVNLSGGSLNDEFFKTFVIALLQRHPTVADRVVLEITETVATQDIFMTRQFASAVRATGARIALDDFGSGYSNFSSLTDMPASFLKIDGRFVNSLRKNELDRQGTGLSIIRTISLLAHELQMSCVAEWVEDLETLQTLRSLGVDFAQGHAVAHPVPLDRLLAGAGNPKLLVNDHVVELISSPVAPDLHAMESLAEKVQSRSGSVQHKEQDAFIAL